MDTTVAKAFSLLEELAKSDAPLGVTELAQRLGLGKSNVHRLLQTLVALKYVQKTDGSAYVATLRMWEFGTKVVSNIVVRDVARPYMRQLSELTKETVHLSECQGGDVIYLEKIESKEPVRAYTQLGGRARANCTATGKILMAHLPPDDVHEIFRSVTQCTPNTIMDVDRFLQEAAINRKRRYALNNGEWRADINGLASPVADRSGAVVAAIGISAPASRLSTAEMEKYAPDVIETGRQVSLQLGCSPEDWGALAQNVTELAAHS
ncbi:IclR family transcriptional regulator [Oceaniglobus ichthyenteri]|uniref:IclR family transcriptional regulator n=1 Tax=Oceaniglobus ichthyenteri TaxID=2136177 RepID=UPI000D35CFCB|nr:IclR family transcriptional regulator [Oceaniglobus ichthyenteri]